jgi:hypothetical protein
MQLRTRCCRSRRINFNHLYKSSRTTKFYLRFFCKRPFLFFFILLTPNLALRRRNNRQLKCFRTINTSRKNYSLVVYEVMNVKITAPSEDLLSSICEWKQLFLLIFVKMVLVLLAAEGTFGGGNLRDPNIQPIATTLIY